MRNNMSDIEKLKERVNFLSAVLKAYWFSGSQLDQMFDDWKQGNGVFRK